MYGADVKHKIGDLVRITKNSRWLSTQGALGVVVKRPEGRQKSLFIRVYIFKTNREEWLAPYEMDIISNIDE